MSAPSTNVVAAAVTALVDCFEACIGFRKERQASKKDRWSTGNLFAARACSARNRVRTVAAVSKS